MGNAAGGVHVTLHKVSAKFFSGGQRTLQIDARAYLERSRAGAEGSLAQRFAGKIGGEILFVDGRDGEAATVYRDAVGDGQRSCQGIRANRDASAVRLHGQGLDRA